MALLAGTFRTRRSGASASARGRLRGRVLREFELSKPYGSSQLLYIDSEVSLAASAKTTIADIASLRKFSVRRRAGSCSRQHRCAARHERGEEGRNDRQASDTSDRRRGVLYLADVRIPQGHFHAVISSFRVRPRPLVPRDRHTLFVCPASVAKLGETYIAHIVQQFTPVSTVPPAITGTPQQGQTPTASTGTFSMTRHSRTCRQRCNAAGAACATSWVRPHGPMRRGGGRRHDAPRHGHREGPFGTADGESVQTAVRDPSLPATFSIAFENVGKT